MPLYPWLNGPIAPEPPSAPPSGFQRNCVSPIGSNSRCFKNGYRSSPVARWNASTRWATPALL